MVKPATEEDRQRLVLIVSIVTSIVLVIFFAFGAISTNTIRGGTAYTEVDIIAGSIFVLVLTMIISLSLWPKVMDWIDNRNKNSEISKK